MIELVFLLEERSAKEMLRGLLPRVVSPNIAVRYIVFEGKQDLERQTVGEAQSGSGSLSESVSKRRGMGFRHEKLDVYRAAIEYAGSTDGVRRLAM